MGGLSATIHRRSSASVNSTSTQPGCGSSDIQRHRSARSSTTRCYLRWIRRERVASPSGVVESGLEDDYVVALDEVDDAVFLIDAT